MKELVVASNMLNESHQLEAWYECFSKIADGGMLIVDGGSTDGTIEFFMEKGASVILGNHSDFKREPWFFLEISNSKIVVVVDDIIQREGYGPSRNHLREMSRKYFPDAHWVSFFDGDERISDEDVHVMRNIKDELIEDYDVVALPRIDWKLDGTPAKDWRVHPDWQARMTRLHNPIFYIRRLHEQIKGFKRIYTNLNNPKINHYHRNTSKEKRQFIGKVCAMLHEKDEMGNTYPKHHKEEHYLELYKKEGL